MIQIHEVGHDPSAAGNITVSLCGHDDDDTDVPAGMVRRLFAGFVDSATSAGIIADIKAFADQVGTWLGVTEVWLYVPPIRVEDSASNIECRPLVWAFTAPIS